MDTSARVVGTGLRGVRRGRQGGRPRGRGGPPGPTPPGQIQLWSAVLFFKEWERVSVGGGCVDP